MKESTQYKGYVQIYVNGKKVSEGRNLVVNIGKAQMNRLIGGIDNAYFHYIAIGTGNTAPTASDTALEAEVMRESSTNSLTTTNFENDTLHLEATFDITNTYQIEETGIFNASTGGEMLARSTEISASVDAGDTVVVKWDIVAQ